MVQSKFKFWFFLNIIVLFTFTHSFAEECLAYMKNGKFKGQCIDTSVKRAVKILSQNENENEIVISNLHKGGNFYNAVIPLKEVQKISFLVVDLNTKPINHWGLINISHTELRIQFSNANPIKLYPLDVAMSASEPLDFEDDVIISINYMAPAGVKYDPVKGLDSSYYTSVIQIFSTKDEVHRRFELSKFNVYEIPLKVDISKAGGILEKAMIMSQEKQYDMAYNTWSNNCTTVIFDIIDLGLGLKDVKPFRLHSWMIQDTGLKPAIFAFSQRKLISSISSVNLMNKEFGYELFPSDSNSYFTEWLGKSFYIRR